MGPGWSPVLIAVGGVPLEADPFFSVVVYVVAFVVFMAFALPGIASASTTAIKFDDTATLMSMMDQPTVHVAWILVEPNDFKATHMHLIEETDRTPLLGFHGAEFDDVFHVHVFLVGRHIYLTVVASINEIVLHINFHAAEIASSTSSASSTSTAEEISPCIGLESKHFGGTHMLLLEFIKLFTPHLFVLVAPRAIPGWHGEAEPLRSLLVFLAELIPGHGTRRDYLTVLIRRGGRGGRGGRGERGGRRRRMDWQPRWHQRMERIHPGALFRALVMPVGPPVW